MENKRLKWADSLKGWLITLVVLGHAIQYTIGDACYENHIWNLIYSFHMPAFMAVSGFLAFRPSHKYGSGKECFSIIKRRFFQLVVPYFLWSLCFLLVNNEVTFTTLGYVILYPSKVLWFLWVLFCINVISIYGSWLAEKVKLKQEVLIIILCLILAGVMVVLEFRLFGFQYISYYFLFYVLGYYLHKYKEKFDTKNVVVMWVLGVCWFGLAWFWQMHEIPVFLKWAPLPESIIQYVYRYVSAVVAIYLLVVVSPRVLNYAKGWNRFFVSAGYYSLGIYAVHFIIVIGLAATIHSIVKTDSIAIALSFVVAMMISMIAIRLLNKWDLTARMLLGKYNSDRL